MIKLGKVSVETKGLQSQACDDGGVFPNDTRPEIVGLPCN